MTSCLWGVCSTTMLQSLPIKPILLWQSCLPWACTVRPNNESLLSLSQLFLLGWRIREPKPIRLCQKFWLELCTQQVKLCFAWPSQCFISMRKNPIDTSIKIYPMGGCIAQWRHFCFPPSSPEFESRLRAEYKNNNLPYGLIRLRSDETKQDKKQSKLALSFGNRLGLGECIHPYQDPKTRCYSNGALGQLRNPFSVLR